MSLMPYDKLTQIVNSYKEYVDSTSKASKKQNKAKQKSPHEK